VVWWCVGVVVCGGVCLVVRRCSGAWCVVRCALCVVRGAQYAVCVRDVRDVCGCTCGCRCRCRCSCRCRLGVGVGVDVDVGGGSMARWDNGTGEANDVNVCVQ
jgi:hypothetical protein